MWIESMATSDYFIGEWLQRPPNFKVNGLPCHRQVLSKIPYFQGLLSGPFKEKDEAEINLTDVSPATIQDLFRFVYKMIDNDDHTDYTLIDHRLTFVQCLELYQLAEFLCYDKLKTAIKARLRYIEMNEEAVPYILNHVVNETDVSFRDWLICLCTTESIRWRLDVSSWSRNYLDKIIEATTLSIADKFDFVMRWLMSRPKPVATEDLEVLKKIDLRALATSWVPSCLASLEMVFALNRPEITATICRELFYALTPRLHHNIYGKCQPQETNWSTFNLKEIQFSAIQPVRDGMHRIKLQLPHVFSRGHSPLVLTLPPLRLTSVQFSPNDNSYTLKLEFPEPMTFQYALCRQKLVELQDHCARYLDQLDAAELVPFKSSSRDPHTDGTKSATTSIATHLIGIIHDSRARPSILVRTQLAETRLEGSRVQIKWTDVSTPCWIRLSIKLYIAIGAKLSIVRTVTDSEVRMI